MRGKILTKPTIFSEEKTTTGWLKKKDIVNGLLTIEVDFTGVDELKPSAANGSCKPATFCEAKGDSCGCKLDPNDPMLLANPGLRASCERSCSHWAMKDLDCPEKGCFAVGIKLASDFVANDILRRPQPDPFPGPTVMSLSPGSGDRGWETLFSITSTLPDGKPLKTTDAKGACYYEKVPGTAECLSPPN
jgi:hypothetical protein